MNLSGSRSLGPGLCAVHLVRPPPEALVFTRASVALMWGALVYLGGLGVLLVAGSRLGEGQSSSYGATWTEFTSSWGGQIVVEPPTFELAWTELVEETDAVLNQRVVVERARKAGLPVVDVNLRADFTHSYQTFGSLTSNGFSSRHDDRYRVRNDAGVPGSLNVRFNWPAGASILTGYRVVVDGTPIETARLDEGFSLLPELAAGAEAEVAVAWATKGADAFTYRLSAFRSRILPHFGARYRVDTDRFALLRFGLDQVREREGGGSVVTVDLADLSTSQDLGLRFASQRTDLAFAERLLDHAPFSLLAFLALVFVASQAAGLRPDAVHALTMTATHTTFFVFVAYLVRWWSLEAAVAGGTALSLLLAALFGPGGFGWRFCKRTLFPAVLAFTAGFSALFLLPSVAELAFFFVVGVALLAGVSRFHPGRWPLLNEPAPDQ